MKQIKLISALLFLQLIAFQILGQQLVGDELLELSDNAAEETNEVQVIVNDLFTRIEKAIEETNEIAKLLTDAEDSKTGLNKKIKNDIKIKLEAIHAIYEEISDNEDSYKRDLKRSSQDAIEIVDKTKDILKRELNEIRILEKERDNISKNDEESINRRKTLNIKIRLKKIIIETLESFNKEMGNFKNSHKSTKDKIEKFFTQVQNSYEITEVMIEVIDLSIKVELIRENIQSLQEIDSYTRQMYESLNNLSKSLEYLKEIAVES